MSIRIRIGDLEDAVWRIRNELLVHAQAKRLALATGIGNQKREMHDRFTEAHEEMLRAIHSVRGAIHLEARAANERIARLEDANAKQPATDHCWLCGKIDFIDNMEHRGIDALRKLKGMGMPGGAGSALNIRFVHEVCLTIATANHEADNPDMGAPVAKPLDCKAVPKGRLCNTDLVLTLQNSDGEASDKL